MSHPALRIAAARHFLGLARPAEIIDAAHAALDDGIYSYNLGEVATYREPVWGADVRALFKSALGELGIVVPSRGAAIDVLTEAHIVPLAEGATEPIAAVARIHLDYVAVSDSSVTTPEHATLARFDSLYRRYEHCYENEFHVAPQLGQPTEPYRQERERLDAECVQLAQAWCWNRWQSSIDPSWLTSTVTDLARGIYDDRAFDRLPILADALQDAGCDHPDILDHCRSPGPHVRGCWVVDLLLGRPWREPA